MGNMIGSAEAAEILGVSRATVLRWADADRDIRLPGHKLPGETGAYVFDRADVEALRDELAAQQAAAEVGI